MAAPVRNAHNAYIRDVRTASDAGIVPVKLLSLKSSALVNNKHAHSNADNLASTWILCHYKAAERSSAISTESAANKQTNNNHSAAPGSYVR